MFACICVCLLLWRQSNFVFRMWWRVWIVHRAPLMRRKSATSFHPLAIAIWSAVWPRLRLVTLCSNAVSSTFVPLTDFENWWGNLFQPVNELWASYRQREQCTSLPRIYKRYYQYDIMLKSESRALSHFRFTFALASRSIATTSLLRCLIAVWRTVSDSQNLLGSALELIINLMISWWIGFVPWITFETDWCNGVQPALCQKIISRLSVLHSIHCKMFTRPWDRLELLHSEEGAPPRSGRWGHQGLRELFCCTEKQVWVHHTTSSTTSA